MYDTDTICAISSPAGCGAIALVRLGGPNAIAIADRCLEFPKTHKTLAAQKGNTVHFANILRNGQVLDEVVVTLFRSPHSYTGDNLVEIGCHGSVYIQQKILELLIEKGARLARPGEFTQRAFLNGKMDLSQAEGVADLIASSSEAAHRLAMNQMRGGFSIEIGRLREQLLHFVSLIELELDFSEEDVEFADRSQLATLIGRIGAMLGKLLHSFEQGNAIKHGIPVAIVGRTNSGKSTLLNQLLREEKAIVSDIAGTTRDYLEDTFTLQGIQFRFIDTAGLRHTQDTIEREGIQRSLKKYEQAALVMVMVDPADPMEQLEESLGFLDDYAAESSPKRVLFVLNKVDLLTEAQIGQKLEELKKRWGNIRHFITLSAKLGIGLQELENQLVNLAGITQAGEQDVVVTNARHFEALRHARQALDRVVEGLEIQLPSDLMAQDIREILHYLGEITGEISTDEVLGNIFKNFCIGK